MPMNGSLFMSRSLKFLYALPIIFWISIFIFIIFLKKFDNNDYPPALFIVSLLMPTFITYRAIKWGINLVNSSISIIYMTIALWLYGIPLAILEAPLHINSNSDFLLYVLSFWFYSLWTPGLVVLTCWLLFFAKSKQSPTL